MLGSVVAVYRIHRSIDVSFSHHVRGHRGPCINLHGHTWKLEVGLAAAELDAQGFVVDFGELSARVLKPCHALLDHALAVGETTYVEISEQLVPLGERLLASREAGHGASADSADSAEWADASTRRAAASVDAQGDAPPPLNGATLRYPGGLKVCVFPFSPTSERLARWLYDLASAELGSDRVRVDFARVYETLHPVESVAEYRPPSEGPVT